jgi:hypothetical protein
MLKVRKHVGDMFFLGFQSTQSLGKFTGEEGNLFSDVYKGDELKARFDPPLLGGALGTDGPHPYVETRPHTPLTLHLTPIHSHFTPLHLTSPHSIFPLLYAPLHHHLCISSCTSAFSHGNCQPDCNK